MLLLLIALILILLLLPLATGRRFEQLAPPFAFGVMTALLPFAMAGRLSAFVWLAVAAAAALAVLALVKCLRERSALRRWPGLLLTPGFVSFALLAVLLYYSAQPRMVWWGDDIRYWAMEAKSLYLSDGLLDGYWHLSPDFSTYTPGMPLLEWLGATLYGEWNEGVLFYVKYLFCTMIALPVFEKITWKKAYWAPLALAGLLLFPTVFNGFTFYALCVDTAIGLCFGYALCQLWGMRREASGFRMTCFALALCALVLLKQADVLLVLLTVPFLWVAGLKKKPVPWLAAYAPAAALLVGWLVYSRLNGLNGTHTANTFGHIADMLRGAWQPPEGFERLPEALWQGLTNDMSGFAYMEWHAPVEIPCLWQMLFFCVAPLLLIPLARQRGRDMKRLLIWSTAVFALELALTYAGALTTFYNEVGEYVKDGRNMLPALIMRYFCPVFIGLFMVETLIVTDAVQGKVKPALLAAAAVAALAAFGNWPSAAQLMLPGNYTAREPDYFASYLEEQNFWTDDLEDPARSIVLYGIGEKQTEPWKWQYALAPVKLVYGEEGNDLPALLRENHVTFVVCLDDVNPVYEAALPYAADGWLDTYTVYAVSWEGDEPVLAY